MEIGEIVGIIFLLGILGVFSLYAYRAFCCPKCGSFRSIERVEVEYIPLDDKTDGKDIILYVITLGEFHTKSSIIKWVDRCNKCGYETKGERYHAHY